MSKQEVVQAASRRYQRAGQVAADAANTMRNRLTTTHGWLNEQANAVVAAAISTIVAEILNDADIIDPEEEE